MSHINLPEGPQGIPGATEILLSIDGLMDADARENRTKSPAVKVIAKTNLSAFPTHLIPASISGRLLGIPFGEKIIELTAEQLHEIRSGHELEVNILGTPYKFKELDENGEFELVALRKKVVVQSAFLAFGLIAVGLLLAFCLYRLNGLAADDSFIHRRIALNLLQTGRAYYNLDQRVMVTSLQSCLHSRWQLCQIRISSPCLSSFSY